MLKAARLWVQWLETLFSEPEAVNSSWLPERMEYAFSIGARLSDGERVLTAQEYFEGHLDWHAFDTDRPLNRFEAHLEQKRRREQESPPEPTTTLETLRYRLTTEILDYWVPLLRAW
jgi:hypothetical protein